MRIRVKSVKLGGIIGATLMVPLMTACGVTVQGSASPNPPSSSPAHTVTVTASATGSSSNTVTPTPSSTPPSSSNAPASSLALSAGQWASLLANEEGSVVKITTYTNDFGTGIISGSGFFADGYLITCYHVISNAHLFIDVWPHGATGPIHAKVVATDPANDLAVLALDDATSFPSLLLGSMANQQLGESVAIVGHPGGGSLYITPGSLVATNATINVSNYGTLSPMIELNAAAIGGDSGGPLFDTNGHVIGVLEDGATGVAADGGAIPVSTLATFLSQVPASSA